jgi:hypothetical protein
MKALKRACLEKPIGPYLEGTLSGIGDISLVHRDFLLLKFL